MPGGNDNKLHLIINGKSLIFSLGYDNTPGNIKNETEFYFSYKPLTQETLSGRADIIGRIFLSGYFGAETNISILSESGNTDDSVFFGYMPNTLEVEKVEDFKIPTPYTNIATKVDGVAKHSVDIKKEVVDGVTFGAVMSFNDFGSWHNFLQINKEGGDYITFHRVGGDASKMEIAIGGEQKIPLQKIKLPIVNRGVYVQMSINFKSKTITVQMDDVIETIDINKYNISSYDNFMFGDSRCTKYTNFITNMWYWLGDTVDIKNQ